MTNCHLFGFHYCFKEKLSTLLHELNNAGKGMVLPTNAKAMNGMGGWQEIRETPRAETPALQAANHVQNEQSC